MGKITISCVFSPSDALILESNAISLRYFLRISASLLLFSSSIYVRKCLSLHFDIRSNQQVKCEFWEMDNIPSMYRRFLCENYYNNS